MSQPTPDHADVPPERGPSENVWAPPTHREVIDEHGSAVTLPGTDAPAGSVLPTAPAPRRRRTGLVVGLVAGGVLLAGGAAAAVAVGTALGGGGDQPEDHLPATAVAFAKVDLDPAAGQKIDAIRFLRTLPRSEDVPEDESGDLRQWAYETLTEQASGAPAWEDVEPWLGQRAGVAVLPPGSGDEPDVVVAVQVTDEARARATLDDGVDGWGAAVADGWAVIAPTAAAAQAAADAAADAPLAADAEFTADLDALGEDGVATAWGDLAELGDLAKAAAPLAGSVGGAADLEGRAIAALRFDGPRVELAGRVVGADVSSFPTGPSGVASLPGSTTLAVGAAVAPGTVEKFWTANEELIIGAAGGDLAAIEEGLGVSLPEDLVALVGDGLTVAAQDVQAEPPVVGVVGRGGADASAALGAVEQVAELGGFPLERRDADAGWVLATTSGWADELAAGGDLGDSEAVRGVLPDVDTAPLALYVDLAALAETLEADGEDAEAKQALTALRALGMSGSLDGDTATFSVRLGG